MVKLTKDQINDVARLKHVFANNLDIAHAITYSTGKPIASRVVELCKELGVLITPAGSTFPKNYDPNDSVIRLAPTYVSKDELDVAMEVFVTAVEIAHFDIIV